MRPAIALVLLTACTTQPKYKGDLVLGSFAFDGPRAQDDCPFDTGNAPRSPPRLSFTGVFSVDSKTGTLYLSVNGVDRQGTLVGSHFSLSSSAPRDLGCTGCQSQVNERIEGDFYGLEQAQALDGSCPPPATRDAGTIDAGTIDGGPPDGGALDSGVVDGGVLDGGWLDAGAEDAGAGPLAPVLACAVIGDDVSAGAYPDGGACGCGTKCTLQYLPVTAVRL